MIVIRRGVLAGRVQEPVMQMTPCLHAAIPVCHTNMGHTLAQPLPCNPGICRKQKKRRTWSIHIHPNMLQWTGDHPNYRIRPEGAGIIAKERGRL